MAEPRFHSEPQPAVITLGGPAGDSSGTTPDADLLQFQLLSLADDVATATADSVRASQEALVLLHEEHRTRLEALLLQLQREQEALVALHARTALLARTASWKTLAVATAAALVMLGGSAWLAYQNVRTAEANAALAERQRLLGQIVVGSCAGRPCVQIPADAERWGRKRDFILLGAPSRIPKGEP